ncbi:MAG: T9SS type A sorting domain-containing protein, partial [Fimbriimonadaceae bacterium]|nr:T9SS type A sorting domain-containing protein [Chitinophagales bacterium]
INAITDMHVLIYPNPTDAIIHIQFDQQQDINHIQVFNVFGKICYQSNGQIEKEIKIDLSNFSNGVYIIQINTRDFIQNYQVIKQG